MKHLLAVIALAIALPSFAQDDGSYAMFQVINIKAKAGHGQELNAALEAHNDKYHQEGAEAVNVWAIRTGPRTGTHLWAKGPRTWTDMDSPIEGDEHLDDWRETVVPHAHMGEWEFWRLANGMNYSPEGFNTGLAVVRYFEIAEGKWDNARRHWEKIFELYNEKNWDTGLQVYFNQANAGDGKDWAVMWFHENWASMDKDRDFFGQFEEMHGMDTEEFFEVWEDAADFKGMEIFELVDDLSVMGSND